MVGDERQGCGVDIEVEMGGKAVGTHDPERIGGKGIGRAGTDDTLRQVDGSVQGVQQVTRSAGHGKGVDGEIAQGEVGSNGSALKGSEIADVPLPLQRDAGMAPLFVEGEEAAADPGGNGPGQVFPAGADHDVNVIGRPRQQGIADAPTHEPRAEAPLPGKGRYQGRQWRGEKRKDSLVHGSSLPPDRGGGNKKARARRAFK